MDTPQLFFSFNPNQQQAIILHKHFSKVLNDSKSSAEYSPQPGFFGASLDYYVPIVWRKYHVIFQKTDRSWRPNLTQPKVFVLSVVSLWVVTVYCVAGSFICHHVTRCSSVQRSPMHHLLHIIFWNSVKTMKQNAPSGCLTHAKPFPCSTSLQSERDED